MNNSQLRNLGVALKRCGPVLVLVVVAAAGACFRPVDDGSPGATLHGNSGTAPGTGGGAGGAGGGGGGGGGGGTLFPEGCGANAHPPSGGALCTASCADCDCTAINYVCDKSCYSASGNTCLINASSDGTPRPSGEYANNCTSLSCAPENDLSTELSCTATNCQPPSPPVDPPVVDAGSCPGDGCKPGAIRYCDVPGLEWSKSTCDATGNWGPCLATAPLVGYGCDANDYSPELCCPHFVQCCQDNPGGPFVDFGSGACAATTCRQIE